MRKAYCEYCKQIKSCDYGSAYGPQDCFYQCLDCCIKEEGLRIKQHQSQYELLMKLKNSIQPERLNEMDAE
jgi:hypothetical protein